MACRVCGYTNNPPGAEACGACGTSLVSEPKPVARAGDAVCAKHPTTPALATCDRCGTFHCAVCLERAADGKMYCVDCRTRGSQLPWDRRHELGMLRAWFQTSTKLLTEPQATLANAQRDGDLGSSILFTLISSIAGFITTLVLYGLLFAGMLAAGASQANELNPEGNGPGAAAGVGIGIGVFLFYVVLLIGGQVTGVLLLSGIEHLALKLLGEKDLAGYTVTVRAHALGLSPYVIGLIPVCGAAVMGIWSLVLRCLTLVHLQRVSTGKAIVAVLSPLVLICGCAGVGYVVAVAAVVSTLGALKG